MKSLKVPIHGACVRKFVGHRNRLQQARDVGVKRFSDFVKGFFQFCDQRIERGEKLFLTWRDGEDQSNVPGKDLQVIFPLRRFSLIEFFAG
jgi:hypothetical protein